jgi:poly-gamma-glutamate synthesis protein (capsule biosynthesis protein)
VYRQRPIFYGCGDFINDYEGIGRHEEFRDELPLMYFVTLAVSTGELACVRMVPLHIDRFRLKRASVEDTRWIIDVLNREGQALGTRAAASEDGTLELEWASSATRTSATGNTTETHPKSGSRVSTVPIYIPRQPK